MTSIIQSAFNQTLCICRIIIYCFKLQRRTRKYSETTVMWLYAFELLHATIFCAIDYRLSCRSGRLTALRWWHIVASATHSCSLLQCKNKGHGYCITADTGLVRRMLFHVPKRAWTEHCCCNCCYQGDLMQLTLLCLRSKVKMLVSMYECYNYCLYTQQFQLHFDSPTCTESKKSICDTWSHFCICLASKVYMKMKAHHAAGIHVTSSQTI